MIYPKILIPIIAAVALLATPAFAEHEKKILYPEAVAPVLHAKCGGCHGADKQKGKLRVDSLAALIKGGSDGTAVVPGKPDESLLLQRVHLPLDDDEHMPPEDKDQLTGDEIAVLQFWIQSGADDKATIESLKATAEVSKAIAAVFALAQKPTEKTESSAPVALSDADKKLIADTVKTVNDRGGNLMAIAQNTPQLRFSALNVAKEFTDKDLDPLKAVGQQILWLDLARTQVSDGGLAALSSMKNLTRLHLENTKVTDAGLDHVKGLSDLEYLNLYGTGITDAGIAKLSTNKKLKKLFLWQTKTTDNGVSALAKAVPGIDINTGWKEPVVVAAVVAAPEKPAAPVPAKPTEPAKPTPPPTQKPEPPKPTTPPVVKTVPAPAPKPVTVPAPAAAPKTETSLASLETALTELTAAAAKAKKDSAEAKSAYEAALKKAEEATRQADALKTSSVQASDIEGKTVTALQELIKAVEASRKK